MFLNILVAIDGSPSSQRALEHSIDLARTGNAKLTLITVPRRRRTTLRAQASAARGMQAELESWARGILEEAARTVPDDVLAHTVQRSGRPGPEIVAELERGGYDLIVLGTRGRGRTQEGLMGSVNGYVHFHARVPLLSVPDEPSAA